MSRPNRNRKKSTVYLSAEDRERVEIIRRRFKLNTDASAIRKALEIATTPLEPDVLLMVSVLEWASKLQWLTPKDKRELHVHTKDLYKMVCRRNATVNKAASALDDSKEDRLPDIDGKRTGCRVDT